MECGYVVLLVHSGRLCTT